MPYIIMAYTIFVLFNVQTWDHFMDIPYAEFQTLNFEY